MAYKLRMEDTDAFLLPRAYPGCCTCQKEEKNENEKESENHESAADAHPAARARTNGVCC